MSAPSPERDVSAWSGLVVLLRTFAARPRNWIVLARNLIPVVGVYAFAWSGRVSILNYWVDGVCMLGLLMAAVFVRGAALQRQKPGSTFLGTTTAAVIGFAMFFGMLGIPYWMVYGMLDLGVPVYEVSQSRELTVGLLSTMIGSLVAAFQRGGYFGMQIDELKKRAQPELEILGTRAIAMLLIASWTHGVLFVPLFALVLTAFEVWPAMKTDLGLD